MSVERSPEVEQMEQRERSRWLTVAEARRVRGDWEQFRKGMDTALEKFDADPENETEAMLSPKGSGQDPS